MFLWRAVGAALLAVPLATASGQTSIQDAAPSATTGDSVTGHERLAWAVTAGATGAAVFTTFVRLSQRDANVTADRGLPLPNSPVPNHYTDGILPGTGVSPGQNAPLSGQTSDKSPTDGQTQDSTTVTSTVTSEDQPLGILDIAIPPPPQMTAQLAVSVVATPEPASLALLGTGLAALFPALRRRKSAI